MPHSVVITSAKTGPDRTIAGQTFPNVVGVDFQLNDKRLFIQTEQTAGDNIKEIDLSAVAAVTVSIVTGNWTVTVA
jgi:hypothetical protein